jgi:hypothetical protein
MKLAAYLLGILSLVSTSTATPPGPFVAESGQMSGNRYELWFDYFEHVTAEWNPEKDDWLMSTKEAILAARAALAKMVGAPSELFECREVRMHRFWTPAGKEKATFYFIVVFESMKEAAGARKVDPGIVPAILPFLVYPEGYVKSPVKKEPNKAPEPTPTSVTDRAAHAPRQP